MPIQYPQCPGPGPTHTGGYGTDGPTPAMFGYFNPVNGSVVLKAAMCAGCIATKKLIKGPPIAWPPGAPG